MLHISAQNLRRLFLLLPIAWFGLILLAAVSVRWRAWPEKPRLRTPPLPPAASAAGASDPVRATSFIESRRADARILNPLLQADSASNDLMQRRIFESLVDNDEQQRLVPRLAEAWQLTEQAYIWELPERRIANGAPATLENLRLALNSSAVPQAVATEIQLIDDSPAQERSFREEVLLDAKKTSGELTGQVRLPRRVRLHLKRVLPDLFTQLAGLLGPDYPCPGSIDAAITFDHDPFGDQERALAALGKDRHQLASPCEHNPILTFDLRKNVRFHDGVPFTSADVVFTYQALVDPKNNSPRISNYAPIRGAVALGPHRVQFEYARLHSTALLDWQMGIVPEHLLNARVLAREAARLAPDLRARFSLRDAQFNRHPIGTGPFRFVEWKSQQYAHVTRFDDYWGERPQLRDIYTRVLPDPLTEDLELQAGAIDSFEVLPYQVARFSQDPKFRLLTGAEGHYSYIAYNLRRPALQDVRVRRALGMAIDVDAIIRYVLHGQGRRSSGPFYSHTPFADPSTPLLSYDPKAAAELLETAGFRKNPQGWFEKDGRALEFTLLVNNGNPQRKLVATIAQEAWAKLGVRCKVQASEWAVFLRTVMEAHDFDAIVLAWVGADLSPDRYEIWHSSASSGGQNMIGYANPEADRLMEAIRSEYDRDQQIRLARALHRTIAADQPYTFLYEPLTSRAVPKNLVMPDPADPRRLIPIQASRAGEPLFHLHAWRRLPTPTSELVSQ